MLRDLFLKYNIGHDINETIHAFLSSHTDFIMEITCQQLAFHLLSQWRVISG